MEQTTLINQEQIISTHTFCEVVFQNASGQHLLRSLIKFKENEIVCHFEAEKTVTTPNYLTVQINENKHIHLFPSFLQYINHSCDPNVFFDVDNMKLITLKDIYPGDEFCFFYPSTELHMDQSFFCTCGFKNCLVQIRGAAEIPKDILSKYQRSSFIQHKTSTNH